jgi:hypothetical protein
MMQPVWFAGPTILREFVAYGVERTLHSFSLYAYRGKHKDFCLLDAAACSVVDRYQGFGGICCLYLLGRRVSRPWIERYEHMEKKNYDRIPKQNNRSKDNTLKNIGTIFPRLAYCLPWRWKQCISLHNVTSQKTCFFIVIFCPTVFFRDRDPFFIPHTGSPSSCNSVVTFLERLRKPKFIKANHHFP